VHLKCVFLVTKFAFNSTCSSTHLYRYVVVAFFRNPWALLATAFFCFSLLCTNDSFAQTLSEKVTRAVRRYHPPAAAWMRRNASASS
jgi:hypothetical protein